MVLISRRAGPAKSSFLHNIHFKRRKTFPTQEIKEEREDGTLIVSLKVGHYGEVRDILNPGCRM